MDAWCLFRYIQDVRTLTVICRRHASAKFLGARSPPVPPRDNSSLNLSNERRQYAQTRDSPGEHTHTCKHTHAYRNTHARAYAQAHARAHTYNLSDTRTHASKHARTQTPHAGRHIFPYTHIFTKTGSHPPTHTHTHTRTRAR